MLKRKKIDVGVGKVTTPTGFQFILRRDTSLLADADIYIYTNIDSFIYQDTLTVADKLYRNVYTTPLIKPDYAGHIYFSFEKKLIKIVDVDNGVTYTLVE